MLTPSSPSSPTVASPNRQSKGIARNMTLPKSFHQIGNFSKWRGRTRHFRHHLHFINLYTLAWMKSGVRKSRQCIQEIKLLKSGIQAGYGVLKKGLVALYQKSFTFKRIPTTPQETTHGNCHEEETKKFWRTENTILHDDHKVAGAWSIPLE